MRSERGRGVGRRVQGAWAAPGLGPRGSGAAERSSGHTGLAEKRPELRGPGCRDPAARGLVYRVSTWRGPSQAVRTPHGPGDQGAALSQLCACSFGDPLTLTRLPPAPRPQRGLEACCPVARTEACGARGSLRPLSPRLGSREKQDGANPSAGDISAGRGPSEPPAAGSRVGDLQRPCWSAGRGAHGLSVPGALALPDAPELRRSSDTVPVRPFRKHFLEPGRGCLVRTAPASPAGCWLRDLPT